MSTTSTRFRGGLAALCCAGLIVTSALAASPASAAFGFVPGSVGGHLDADASGSPATQAGSHPFEGNVTFDLNTTRFEDPGGGAYILPEGSLKTAVTDFPPGLIGNPQAVPQCKPSDFLSGTSAGPTGCSNDAQIGFARIVFAGFQEEPSVQYFQIFNLVPSPGEPARFAARLDGAGEAAVLNLDGSLRTGEAPGREYGLTLTAANIESLVPVEKVSVTLWGVPASPAHNAYRGACLNRDTGPEAESPESPRCQVQTAPEPLITMPTRCTASPLATTLTIDSWASPGAFQSATFPYTSTGGPSVVDGCDALSFRPSLTVAPTTMEAEAPTGLAVDLRVPQDEEAAGLATPALRNVVVDLPEGMAVNPSAANGLGSCSASQIDLAGAGAATCPDDAKIGSVEIDTPLLDHPLPGSIYVARQGENKFGSLLAVYLAFSDPATGVVVKVPGRIQTTASGRLTASFEDAPQLPFEELKASFFGGDDAALVTPSTCGTYATTAALTPWSGTAPVYLNDSFEITSGPGGSACPNGGFEPKLTAGSVNPVAAAYTPFVLKLTRADGTQRLSAITAKLPAGLLAKLAGVPYCPDASIAAIPTAEGSGARELAAPSCPAASQVGTVSVGAGAGRNPFNVNTGRVYLAGPYKGAPLSLAIATPALAGPFDLGTVVVRAALRVDPETTQITAVADPLPTVLAGIPLDLRSVAVSIDRKEFTVNPTSCAPTAVAATVTGVAGAVASPSDRYQVADCASLAFEPKLALQLKGGTRRGKFPALTATLDASKDRANIARISVGLPHSEFLAQGHIGTVCTRVQFTEGSVPGEKCPAASVYGRARAITPLLSNPLEGPVYLRSSSNKLPDLVTTLNGQITVVLDGRIDSFKGGIRVSFTAVPDAPVSRFVLAMKGGKRGLLENSTDLCEGTNLASVKALGQNGAQSKLQPAVVAKSCA